MRDRIAKLIDELKDPDSNKRVAAAATLGCIGPAAGAAVPALREALNDPDAGVKILTAVALGKIGDPAAVPSLAAALKDAKPVERDAVAGALDRLEWKAVGAVEALTEALDDPDRHVRETAVRAIRRIVRVPPPGNVAE
jgi:HEAT repeat protein